MVILSDKVEVCSACGCRLGYKNRSIDARLCIGCFDAEMSQLEAEDEIEDSMSDAERKS